MSGDDGYHAHNTLRPAEILLTAAANRAGSPPRLVMVSSIAVYNAAALAEGATLDETTPLEANPDARDAYCRSKLALEALTLWAADAHNLKVRIMRPGAVFGPGRLWNGHIGQALGPLVVQMEKRGQVPVSFVNHCAEALVLAAERPVEHDDRTGPPAGGRVEIINVLDDDLPDRARYMEALRGSGWPRFVVPGSWRPLAGLADMLSYLGERAPVVKSKLPGLLRPAIIHSRMKPLAYSNARLHDRLGWQSGLSFEEAMRRSYTGKHEDKAYVPSK
jgi:nucleoside-diphosphate-sugar epimerase